MKSNKVINDMFEYLVLFGSREDPDLNVKIEYLNWVLQNDLENPIK